MAERRQACIDAVMHSFASVMATSIPLGKITAAERSEGLLSLSDTAWQRCSDLRDRVSAADAASIPKLVRILLDSGMLDAASTSVFAGANLACRAATLLAKDTLVVRCQSPHPSFDKLSPLALWILVNHKLLGSLSHLVLDSSATGVGVGRQGSTVLSALVACGFAMQSITGSWLHPDSLLEDVRAFCDADSLPWAGAAPAVWDEQTESPTPSVLLLPSLLSASQASLESVQWRSDATDAVAAAQVLDLTRSAGLSAEARLASAAWSACLHRECGSLESLSMQWDYDIPAPLMGNAQLVYKHRNELQHLHVLVSRAAAAFPLAPGGIASALLRPATKPFVDAPEGEAAASDESPDAPVQFVPAEGVDDHTLDAYPRDEVGVLPTITMPETFPALWCRGLETLQVHVRSEECVSIQQDKRVVWSLHNNAIPAIAATIEANTSTLKHLSITATLGTNHVHSHNLMSAISRCRLQSLSLHLSFPWHQPEAFAWAAQLAAEEMAGVASAADSKEQDDQAAEEAESEAPAGLFTDWRRDVCPDVSAAVDAESVFASDLQSALHQQARSLRKLHLTVNSAPEVAAFNLASKNLKRISSLSVSVGGRLSINPADEKFADVAWPAPPARDDDASTTTASTLVQTYDVHSFWAGANIPSSLMATVSTSGGDEEDGDDDDDDDDEDGDGKDDELWDEDDDEDGESESKFSASLVGSVGRPFSAKSKGSRPFSARSRGSRPFSARSRGRPVSAKDRASQALTRPKRKTFPKGNVRNYAARRLDAAALLAHTLRAFPTGLRQLPISVTEGSKAFPAYAHKWWWGCYLDAMRTHATTLTELKLSGAASWCSGTATVLIRKLFRTAECSVRHVHLTLPSREALHPLIPHLLAEGLEGLHNGLQTLVLDRAAPPPKAAPAPAASTAAAGSGNLSPAGGSQKQLKAGIGSFQGSHIGSEVSGAGELQEAGDLAPLLAAWRPVAGPRPAALRLLWDLTPAEIQSVTEALTEMPEGSDLAELHLQLGARIGVHRPVPEVLQDLFSTLADLPQAQHMRKLTLEHLPCDAMGTAELSGLMERLRWLESLSLGMRRLLGTVEARGLNTTSDSPGGVGDSDGHVVNAEPVPTLKDLQDAAELEDQGYAVDALLAAAKAGQQGKALQGTVKAVAGLLLDTARESVQALHTARSMRTARKPGHEFAPLPADIDLSVDALDLPPQHKWVSPWALRLVDELAQAASLPNDAEFLHQLLTAYAEVGSAGLTHKLLLQCTRGGYPQMQQLALSLPCFSSGDLMAVALAVSADSPHVLTVQLQRGFFDPKIRTELQTLQSIPLQQHDEPLEHTCSAHGVRLQCAAAFRRLACVDKDAAQTMTESGTYIANVGGKQVEIAAGGCADV